MQWVQQRKDRKTRRTAEAKHERVTQAGSQSRRPEDGPTGMKGISRRLSINGVMVEAVIPRCQSGRHSHNSDVKVCMSGRNKSWFYPSMCSAVLGNILLFGFTGASLSLTPSLSGRHVHISNSCQDLASVQILGLAHLHTIGNSDFRCMTSEGFHLEFSWRISSGPRAHKEGEKTSNGKSCKMSPTA